LSKSPYNEVSDEKGTPFLYLLPRIVLSRVKLNLLASDSVIGASRQHLFGISCPLLKMEWV